MTQKDICSTTIVVHLYGTEERNRLQKINKTGMEVMSDLPFTLVFRIRTRRTSIPVTKVRKEKLILQLRIKKYLR